MSKQDLAVAPIFRSRTERGPPRADDPPESDYDSEISDLSNGRDTAPVTKKDLKGFIRDINANMATELAKHIKAGLDAIEDKMEDLTTTTSNHDSAIPDHQDQLCNLEDLNNRSRPEACQKQ
ncbi:Hypothetical predicted protein [Pelobates cultripes]|uniref:Uncharacterized protein n=1 Tax=Pelobates cultripes TaxID=61616 RepID=A0AAD1VSL7_PELCU|nr:Hypothetical predicted protein [Pelobates cultripes]